MDDIAIIENKIYEIRGQKVMLDFDLAEMYGVETKRLKEQVRRNIERFPAEFMFELTKEEVQFSRSQIATLKTGQGHNIKYLPFAFTEYGIVMLSSVLKSKTAVEVNINIIRAFVRMRQYLLSNVPQKELEELKQRIEYLEEDITSDRESYEKQFDDLFNAFAKISAIIQSKQTPLDRVKIEGFKTNNKEKIKFEIENLNAEYKVLISQKIKDLTNTTNEYQREIIENTYKELEKDKTNRIEQLQKILEQQEDLDTEKIKKLKTAIEYFDDILKSNEPNRYILECLIDKIWIYHDKSVKFELKPEISRLL